MLSKQANKRRLKRWIYSSLVVLLGFIGLVRLSFMTDANLPWNGIVLAYLVVSGIAATLYAFNDPKKKEGDH